MASEIILYNPVVTDEPISRHLIERVDVTKLTKLNQLTFEAFYNVNDNTKYSKKSDCEIHYNLIKKYINNFLKNDGITRRTYEFSLVKDTSGNIIDYQKGRLIGNDSIQGINKSIRGYLFGNTTIDIDVVNCHPVILRYLCIKYKIACPNLEYYINNRADIIAGLTESYSAVGGEKNPKLMIIKLMYDYVKNKAPIIKNDWKDVLKNLRTELISIRNSLSKMEQYSMELTISKNTKPDNILGSFLSRVLVIYENDIMSHMVRYVTSKGYEVACYSFDGILVYGNESEIFLEEIEAYVNSQMLGIDLKLSVKPPDTKITDAMLVDIDDDVSEYETYEFMKMEFEKNHCKIINKSLFINEYNNKPHFMNRKNLLDAYEHLNFKDRFNKKVSFIHAWLKDEYIRKYTDVNTYPPPIKCPADIYNTWKPFAMEFVTDYEESDITPLLHHIKILSNHNEAVYTYIIEWIAHMVQLPAEKTTMIVLVGKEGNGKGTLMKVIQKMLGSDKYMETTKPERDVFGNFNGQMAQSYFVHLSELNKKQSADSMDVIKGLITDTALVINQKGKDAFTIDSYHRFFVATNHTEGGIKTYQGDRRKLVAKASDEKIGDSDYFIEMNRYIEDVNYMKSLYEYFKRYEGVANFRNKPIPVTEFQQDLYSLNESPILSYIKDLVSETDVDTLEIPTKEFYTGFNTFLHSNKIHYDVTEKLFTLRLKDITQNIGKKHTRKGMSKILDIVKLRKEFNLGCLIEA